MDDNDLRRLLLESDTISLPSPTVTSTRPEHGARGLKILTGAMIFFWVVGIPALLMYVLLSFVALGEIANRQRPIKMDEVSIWFIYSLLGAAPILIASLLTLIRAYAARMVKLRQVNSALVELFRKVPPVPHEVRES